MPTVHLSLPEALYQELKEIAAETGMSMTNVIRMLIKEGLERRRMEAPPRRSRREESSDEKAAEMLVQVMQQLEQLQRQLEEYQAYVEGELYRINQSLKGLKKRVSKLEDAVEERLIPVEAPELVEP